MPAWGAAQMVAVKTNLLYDALLVPSLGAELGVGQRTTVNLMGTFNPFTMGERKWKNWSLQPEYRYWLHRAFTGPFVGANALVGGFNINKVRVGNLYDHQRQGTMLGGGLSLGYHLILSTRFSLELAAGADFLYCTYDRYTDGALDGRYHSGLILPVGTGVNLVYILR